jgi:hypothetical protein
VIMKKLFSAIVKMISQTNLTNSAGLLT